MILHFIKEDIRKYLAGIETPDCSCELESDVYLGDIMSLDAVVDGIFSIFSREGVVFVSEHDLQLLPGNLREVVLAFGER